MFTPGHKCILSKPMKGFSVESCLTGKSLLKKNLNSSLPFTPAVSQILLALSKSQWILFHLVDFPGSCPSGKWKRFLARPLSKKVGLVHKSLWYLPGGKIYCSWTNWLALFWVLWMQECGMTSDIGNDIPHDLRKESVIANYLKQPRFLLYSQGFVQWLHHTMSSEFLFCYLACD